MKVSNCCGYEIGDPHYLDIGICPDCKEHCDFEEIDEEEETDLNTINTENETTRITTRDKSPEGTV